MTERVVTLKVARYGLAMRNIPQGVDFILFGNKVKLFTNQNKLLPDRFLRIAYSHFNFSHGLCVIEDDRENQYIWIPSTEELEGFWITKNPVYSYNGKRLDSRTNAKRQKLDYAQAEMLAQNVGGDLLSEEQWFMLKNVCARYSQEAISDVPMMYYNIFYNLFNIPFWVKSASNINLRTLSLSDGKITTSECSTDITERNFFLIAF